MAAPLGASCLRGHNTKYAQRSGAKTLWAELRSFLPSMSLDAPESTTEILHSGFEDGAGKHQSSDGEKNVALCLFLNLGTLFAKSHASLGPHRFCLNVSS